MNEDQIGGCMLGYDYIKNHNWLIAVDLSRQKEIDASPKAVQFVRKLRDSVNVTVNPTQSVYALTFFKKIK